MKQNLQSNSQSYENPSSKSVQDSSEIIPMPEHGGDIDWASTYFDIPKAQWLDLSTGISPWSWPVPNIPEHIWRQLPQCDENLRRTAGQYYSGQNMSASNVLTLPGSQFAIAQIPQIIPPKKVALPYLGYKEHEKAWSQAGHELYIYRNTEELAQWVSDAMVEVVVVINPNNPSGERIPRSFLASMQQTLAKHYPKNSLLVVDEAFMDVSPERSLLHGVSGALPDNLIVLRSVGKFFGLAGIRLGFMFAHQQWLARYNAKVPLWSVSHPTSYIGERALTDSDWVQTQQMRIKAQSEQMYALLKQHYIATKTLNTITHTPLFITLEGSVNICREIFLHFAQQGILIRYGENSTHNDQIKAPVAWLRFGLPGEAMERFKVALNTDK